ncbi:NepR family anti-sigma factor [Henriciella litoralis]|nr:NepR family anti-sigma factor [Henriciella litoralis]
MGQALREVYKETVNEPTPPRLKALIEKMREQERKMS